MHSGTWKRREREIAAMFGTVRRPVSGRRGDKGGDDCEHSRLHLQCKHGRQNSREFALFDIAEAVATGNGKIPVIVMTAMRRSEVLVLCRIEDLGKVAKEVVPSRGGPVRSATEPSLPTPPEGGL